MAGPLLRRWPVWVSEESREFARAHEREDGTIAHRGGQLLARAAEEAGGESGIDRSDPMIGVVLECDDDPVFTDHVEDFEALAVEVETYRDADRS